MNTEGNIQSANCYIILTNNVREQFVNHFHDEHTFFNLQHKFKVYIEKRSIENESLLLSFYFDPKQNSKIMDTFGEQVIIFDTAFDLKKGLILINFRIKGKRTPVKTNRRKAMNIHFIPSRINGHTYPNEFLSTIANLPVSKERFEYVNKRISSWEGYIKVLNKNASFDDIETTIYSSNAHSNGTNITFKIGDLKDKEWNVLKGLSVYIQGFPKEIGQVIQYKKKQKSVKVECSAYFTKLIQTNPLDFALRPVTFSNASTKSQLQRLLKGFDQLKEGLSANPNLETILFEDEPTLAPLNEDFDLTFYNNLNPYQQQAVKGAMRAEDLYVIQGPPGTGKTTVISEICFQNVQKGLKTLIASQSNLAVDNALGRLLKNKDIRILRYGRTESIEDEGKQFIEENAADYWKIQTYDAVTNEIHQYHLKKQQLETMIVKHEEEIDEATHLINQLEDEIKQKQNAKQKLQTLQQQLKKREAEVDSLSKERKSIEKELQKLQSTKDQLEHSIKELEQSDSITEIKALEEQKKQQLTEMKKLIQALQLQHEIHQLEQQLQEVQQNIQSITETSESLESVISEVDSYKKIYQLEQFIEFHQLHRGFVLNSLLNDFEKIRKKIESYQAIKSISNRLNNAILYSKKTLGIVLPESQLPTISKPYTLEEINQFLTNLSYAFKEKRIQRQNGSTLMKALYVRKISIQQLYKDYRQLIQESLSVFHKIKAQVIKQYKEASGVSMEQLAIIEQKKQKLRSQLDDVKQQFSHVQHCLPESMLIPSIEELQGVVKTLQDEIAALYKQEQQVEKAYSQVQKMKVALSTMLQQIETKNEALTKTTHHIQQGHRQIKVCQKEMQSLKQKVHKNPEEQLKQTEEKILQLNEKIQSCKKQLTILPAIKEIQQQWKQLLEQAKKQDLDEIKKLYVKHANVIGTTCVASANKEFMDHYPTFDVVIIDEVSKATPPELLLPMLKGKKIILVGDHHQLPPLIGNETFEETLETVIKESDNTFEKQELEKLLEESLFERLYKSVPKSNKQMLMIQYRMHEKIMETIVPFYSNGQDSLQCGLPEPDEQRNHHLQGDWISEGDHLLWFDIPNERNFFEKRMKEGTSLYNESELKVIRKLLIDLNNATDNAIQTGKMEQGTKKSVGVISFYAEQIRKINQIIEEEGLAHLYLRTGSVDKFQGMEMDVILFSMVRNNHYGEIGFAKDYRRLNVALSRARELLVLVGSSDMFTKCTKKEKTKKMYHRLLDIVIKQNGYRNMKSGESYEIRTNN